MSLNPLYRIIKRVTDRVTVAEAAIDAIVGPAVPDVITAAGAVSSEQALVGVIVSNPGASDTVTFTLPAATPGMRVMAIVKAVQELRLDPNETETIALPSAGVQGAAGKYLVADAIGESVELTCVVAGTWDAVGPIDGTWTHEA